MQGGTQGHLHRLQIGSARLVAFGKDKVQQAAYFPRDLLMDRSSRFFSPALQCAGASSTGRNRQTFSLMATRSALSPRKR
jgi:hypothetical protein